MLKPGCLGNSVQGVECEGTVGMEDGEKQEPNTGLFLH